MNKYAFSNSKNDVICSYLLLDIGINVSRTGSLNPYAILDPVQVSGATISFAMSTVWLTEHENFQIGVRWTPCDEGSS